MKNVTALIALSLTACGANEQAAIQKAAEQPAPVATSVPAPAKTEVKTEVKPGDSSPITQSLFLKSEVELPTCDASRKAVLAYVVSAESFFSCDGVTWTVIEIKGRDGAAGQSIVGAKGDRGEVGERGSDGVSITGPQGVAGAVGATGATGAAGTSGMTIAQVKNCSGSLATDVSPYPINWTYNVTVFSTGDAFVSARAFGEKFDLSESKWFKAGTTNASSRVIEMRYGYFGAGNWTSKDRVNSFKFYTATNGGLHQVTLNPDFASYNPQDSESNDSYCTIY